MTLAHVRAVSAAVVIADHPRRRRTQRRGRSGSPRGAPSGEKVPRVHDACVSCACACVCICCMRPTWTDRVSLAPLLFPRFLFAKIKSSLDEPVCRPPRIPRELRIRWNASFFFPRRVRSRFARANELANARRPGERLENVW